LHESIRASEELSQYQLVTDADFSKDPAAPDVSQESGRGTALLISRDLTPFLQGQPFKIKGVYTEIKIEKEDEKIIIAIVYKPHIDKENDSVAEIREIKARLNLVRLNEKYHDYKATILGDWNEVIIPQWTKLRHRTSL
jgi:hypothetical protein